MNIINGIFEIHEEKIYMLYKLFNEIDKIGKNHIPNTKSEDSYLIKENFIKAMDNDFNTSVAISHIFEYVNGINKLIKENNIQRLVDIKYALINEYKTLGLLQQKPNLVIKEIRNKYLNKNKITKEEIEKLILIRNKYKTEKNYSEADKIREQLYKKGIIIKDNKEKTDWEIIITK